MELDIYTDGACSGNPGPGGWAFVIIRQDPQGPTAIRELWGAESNTTNNRMELTAVISALEEAGKLAAELGASSLRLFTDSQYVQKGITQWIHTWKRNGWKTSSKGPVKNQDLWLALDEYQRNLSISWRWVKGHAGDIFNERCDAMTQEAIASLRRKEGLESGPGARK